MTQAKIGSSVVSAVDFRSRRVLAPMSTMAILLPNMSAQITSRPQNVAFRPERIIIGGTPSDWIVDEVRVGERSQLLRVPGEIFAICHDDSPIRFDVVCPDTDFTMFVTFVGASKIGAPFICSVLGTTVWEPGTRRAEHSNVRGEDCIGLEASAASRTGLSDPTYDGLSLSDCVRRFVSRQRAGDLHRVYDELALTPTQLAAVRDRWASDLRVRVAASADATAKADRDRVLIDLDDDVLAGARDA